MVDMLDLYRMQYMNPRMTPVSFKNMSMSGDPLDYNAPSMPSAVMRTPAPRKAAAVEEYKPTTGAEMEADSRSSIDDLMGKLQAQREASKAQDRNQQWMSFFGKLASSQNPRLLGALGEASGALSETTSKQASNNVMLDQAALADQIKMEQWKQEQAMKAEENLSEAALRKAQIARLGREPSSGGAEASGGATGVLINRLMKEDPTLSVAEALYMLQTGNRSGTRLRDGAIAPLPGAADTKKEFKTAEEQAKIDVDKAAAYPKATAAFNSAIASHDNLFDKVKSVEPRVGVWTAGFMGSPLSVIPGTPAADLEADLKSIKASMGFEELQEMRNNSPTGGALGQVSDFENKLLAAKWANVENSQSPDQLKRNLNELLVAKRASNDRIKAAYEMDFAKQLPKKDVASPPAATTARKPLSAFGG